MKIALMGYARSGKDTVAQMICQELGMACTVAFGNELKRHFHNLFHDIPTDPKPRKGYELFGQYMREIDPDIWIKAVGKKVEYMDNHAPEWSIIVTDLRQPNEAKWAKENGFTIVYVHCSDEIRMGRATGDQEWFSVNSSEEELWMIDYDWVIWNEGSEEALRWQVKNLIDAYKVPEFDQFPL